MTRLALTYEESVRILEEQLARLRLYYDIRKIREGGELQRVEVTIRLGQDGVASLLTALEYGSETRVLALRHSP